MRTTIVAASYLPDLSITKTTAAAFVIVAFSCSATVHAGTFDWTTVGNPGNLDDDTGYGGVDYTYRIGKHEVTNAQYAEFLNTVDPTGTNPDLGGDDGFLYDSDMSSRIAGGINFTGGAANGFKYEIKSGHDDNPVVFVSFFDAMRFVNWLHNGQGAGDTESGVYSIGSGIDEIRSANASFWIPSEDEWYKAAYYDPSSSEYFDYPTGTDSETYSDNPISLNTPDDTNVANFYKDDSTANGYDDGYAVSGSTDPASGYPTVVGAYSQATSPYGTFDQGGNVREWNESILGSNSRGIRGGSWGTMSDDLRATERSGVLSLAKGVNIGFRVASVVPEPSSALLGAVSCLGLLLRRTRY